LKIVKNMIDDQLIPLSFSIHSNKGVYALLLGSGISHAAGIPTSWEIVLDLIRKLAIIENEDCGSDPAIWYYKKFDEEPDYSKLLSQIIHSPAERNQLLRGYFEPNNEELEEGLKIPTDAHKAIADLVKGGYIRVIITTNFDRLLEKALESVNVTPTVISTSDSAEGAIPLQHTQCSIIKVNGDYLDTRFKNTTDELAKYDEPINNLLDRIFDEFGLIVCGWSAKWDLALIKTIEHCKNHRFTTYWTKRGEANEESNRLIKLREAKIILIQDADTFFFNLYENVMALDRINRSHPLSAKLAVTRLKKYLIDDKHRIYLHDFVMQEVENLYIKLSDENLYLFSWEEIPGNDNSKLIDFLKQKFGIDWVETAEIEKIDNGNIINVSTEINHISLNLNQKKTEVIFNIDDVRTDKFIAKMENGKLNIYENFSEIPFSPDELNHRIQRYESLTEVVQSIMINGCYWGDKIHENIWIKCLERIANPSAEMSGLNVWLQLRLYPALLLLYGGGIASIAAENYSTFSVLLTKIKIGKAYADSWPYVLGLSSWSVIDDDHVKHIIGAESSHNPLSEHIFQILREPLKEFLPHDIDYRDCFERFEYLLGLIHADLSEIDDWRGPVGIFGVWDYNTGIGIMNEVGNEISEKGEYWPLLSFNLFNGSIERLQEVKSGFDKFILSLEWH